MRKEFVIKLADKNIGVSCIFDSTYDFCRAYITENKADFNVIVSKDDIDFESMKSARENIAEGHRVICYPDEYLETLALKNAGFIGCDCQKGRFYQLFCNQNIEAAEISYHKMKG